MGLNLNSLVGKQATTEVQFMGETTTVSYDPLYLTQKTINEAQNGDDDSFIEFCTHLLTGWDVSYDNEVVPLTVEGLRTVPLFLIRAIFLEIMAAAGNGDAGKISNAG